MKTILAIQTDSHRFGYAVLRGKTLIAYGTKPLGSGRPISYRIHTVAIPYYRYLRSRYKPEVLVLPTPTYITGSGRNRFLRSLQIELTRHPQATASFNVREVHQAFEPFFKTQRTNKDSIMPLLAKWFPELQELLPPPRRPWDPQHYSIRLFDALALAITYLHHQ